jgi:hypothetical protein
MELVETGKCEAEMQGSNSLYLTTNFTCQFAGDVPTARHLSRTTPLAMSAPG